MTDTTTQQGRFIHKPNHPLFGSCIVDLKTGRVMGMEIAIEFAEVVQSARALPPTDAPSVRELNQVLDMALCEAEKVVLRPGELYRFVPVDGCKSCEAALSKAREAYGREYVEANIAAAVLDRESREAALDRMARIDDQIGEKP